MRRVTVLLFSMVLALAMTVPAWGAGAAGWETSAVFAFSDGEMIEGADARLTRTDSGVSYNLRTAELVKGHAVSVWWVIFNNPDACDGDCAVEDLFVDDVMAAVQSGGGHSVGGSGKAGLAGHLGEGEVTNEHPAFQGGPGLLDARGAEIHLVVRSHGPVQPGNNHQMYNSFEAGCMDFLPQGVMPEEKGECADVQFAVFK